MYRKNNGNSGNGDGIMNGYDEYELVKWKSFIYRQENSFLTSFLSILS
jgi:hypothetical protein